MSTEQTDLAAVVAELRRLESAATPGQWVRDEQEVIQLNHSVSADIGGEPEDGLCWVADLGVEPHDADYIVALHNDAPLLLATIDALTRECDAARAEAARHRALLTRCLPFLGGYECDGQTEGDALTALEDEIEAALVSASGGTE